MVRVKDQDFALRRLQRLADPLTSRGRQRPLPVSVAAQWDRPAYEAVIRRALTIKADLIVTERHRRVHVAPLLLHFNDRELLRQSPVPVLLVKRGGQYDHPVVLAAVDPTHSMDKPAQLDDIILQTSSALATALRGRLHSAHAYVPLPGGERPAHALDAGRIDREYLRALSCHEHSAIAHVTHQHAAIGELTVWDTGAQIRAPRLR